MKGEEFTSPKPAKPDIVVVRATLCERSLTVALKVDASFTVRNALAIARDGLMCHISAVCSLSTIEIDMDVMDISPCASYSTPFYHQGSSTLTNHAQPLPNMIKQ
jgi:hypothetical protein